MKKLTQNRGTLVAAAAIAALLNLAACGGTAQGAGAEPAAPAALGLEPASADANSGDAVQFVANPSSDALDWSVQEAAGGTIDSSGQYVAPDVEGSFHIVATQKLSGEQAFAQIRVKRRVTVAVSPSAVTVAARASQAFTATVGNTTNTAVTWSIQEGATGGAITTAGVYTAPAAAGTFHVVATSVASPTRYAVATVTVTAPTPPPPSVVAVAVSPSVVSLTTAQSMTFTAAVTGSTNTAVSWSVQEGSAGGAITSQGVYTAPGAAGTFHVVAKSSADQTKTSTATVTVTAPAPAVTIAISPATASLTTGQSKTFGATVTGTTNTAVTWSVQEGAAGGTVTSAGVYTAPGAAGTFHVVAKSAADTTKTSVATVTVTAPAPPPASGTQLYVATNGNDSNPGTQAAPWRTIQKAMSSATPGSTVNIAGGTYSEQLTLNVSGSATGGFITFQNLGHTATAGTPGTVGGDTVIVDGGAAAAGSGTMLNIANRSYVRIQGLQFANLNMPFNGKALLIQGTGSHIEILHNKIHHIVANGDYNAQSSIYPIFANSSGLTYLNFSGNEVYACRTGYSEAMTLTGASQWVLANNYFHDLDAIVIDVGSTMGGPAAHHGTIRANRFERIGPTSTFGLMPNENTTIKIGQAIYVQGGHDIIVERNQIANATYGINITAEAGYQPNSSIYVRDNEVSGISDLAGAITVGEWAGEGNTTANVWVTGNTLHGNPFGFEMLDATNVVVKNNLFSGNTTNVYNAYGAAMTLDYNLYSGGERPSQDGHAIIASPQFTTGVQITAASPAWNAGDPNFTPGPSYDGAAELDLMGNPRVASSRVDLGAVEAP